MNNFKETKLHTWHILSLFIFTLTVGSIGVGILIQKNPLIKMFDDNLYEMIHHGFHHPLIDLLIKPFNYNFLPDYLSPAQMPSYYYFMIGLTLIYLFAWKRSLFAYAVFCFLFGTILAMLTSALDWRFIFRERPFLMLPNAVDEVGRQAWEKLSSFPSGHVRETALYATFISSFIPKLKYLMLIFVIFIAYSRVYIGAHFPTDVIAGGLIGYLAAKTTLIISREFQIVLDKKKGTTHGQRPK